MQCALALTALRQTFNALRHRLRSGSLSVHSGTGCTNATVECALALAALKQTLHALRYWLRSGSLLLLPGTGCTKAVNQCTLALAALRQAAVPSGTGCTHVVLQCAQALAAHRQRLNALRHWLRSGRLWHAAYAKHTKPRQTDQQANKQTNDQNGCGKKPYETCRLLLASDCL